MDAMAVFSDVVVLPMMRKFDFRYVALPNKFEVFC